jgi:secondary thiamine-phosphate synthase enzyme
VESFTVRTNSRTEFLDITDRVAEIVSNAQAREGLCCVYVPHTTAGITINENADPSVRRDILMELDKTIPLRDGYRHAEGNSAAHVKSSLVGQSVVVPISDGRLALGTWQGIYFCEFDGPRSRRVNVSIR